VREAFPHDTAPLYLIRDRDRIFGTDFVRCVESMGIEEVVTAPASPWQNPYCERLIGSICRECLNRVIVLNERHLLRVLRSYASYYHSSRITLSVQSHRLPDPDPHGCPIVGTKASSICTTYGIQMIQDATMSNKTAYVRARTEPEVKERAEAVFRHVGLTPSEAIHLFYRQVALRGEMPVELKLPNRLTRDAIEDARHERDLIDANSVEDLFALLDRDD